jgi:hypothetical protein
MISIIENIDLLTSKMLREIKNNKSTLKHETDKYKLSAQEVEKLNNLLHVMGY